MSSIMATNFLFFFSSLSGFCFYRMMKKFLLLLQLPVIISRYFSPLPPHLPLSNLRPQQTTSRKQFVFNFERCNYFEIRNLICEGIRNLLKQQKLFTICYIQSSYRFQPSTFYTLLQPLFSIEWRILLSL